MPNTIAHFGINALATKAIAGGSDIKWILLGAVIPDLPFVLKRAIQFVAPAVDVLDLRLLAVGQASLVFSLLLAFSLSRFSRNSTKVFVVLSVGVLFHLLLDACQTKWGNGPSFFAPFDWHHTNFGLFWPEEMPSFLLTGIGGIFVLYIVTRPLRREIDDLLLPGSKSLLAMSVAFIGYFLLPFALSDSIEQSGAGRVQLIRSIDRTGSAIEIDRARFRQSGAELTFELYANHFISLVGIEAKLQDRGKISVRGTFDAHDVLRADEYHINHTSFREFASIVGLGIVFVYWSVVLFMWCKRK